MDELLSDKRFAYVARDPKFKRIPKAERKVKIDKRFQSMFKDKKFTVQYTIDKRGRPVNQTSSENLKKYYDLSSSEEENDEEEHEKPRQKEKKFRKHKKKGSTKNKFPRSKESNRKNSTSEDATDSPLLEKELLSDKSDNNYLSSNDESISRIKSKEESDANSEEQSDTESESDIDDVTNARNLKLDLKESKKQLNIRSKHESEKLTDDIKAKLRNLSVNYARGEGLLMTDSSSDEESSEDSGNIF